jgi:uncharacterized protein (TIGR03000 family)
MAALVLAALLAPARADESVPADRAVLVVKLPAGATLTIGGHATKQTGAERTFESPPLAAGKTYYYELKSMWKESGQPRTVTRQVLVRAGQRSVVDLTAPEASTATAKPIPAAPPDRAKTRTFLFSYAATVTGLKSGQKARIWLPVPPTNEDQEVMVAEEKLPAPGKTGRDAEYGNEILFVEAAADRDGNIALSRTYRVMRREIRGEARETTEASLLRRFLAADRLVPVGGKSLEDITGKLDLLKGTKLPDDQMAAARMIYDAVNQHMRYSKEGTGWGRGDVLWACDSKHGNCSDFHSLFISLVRANRIPAKFEIGFPIPEKRGAGEVAGYHCWAKFRPQGKGWVPVDISEASKNPSLREYYFGNLTEDRVTFSTGRDITLAPKQDGDPVNFLIYPYVEVDGKPYSNDKVQRKFSYEDVE